MKKLSFILLLLFTVSVYPQAIKYADPSKQGLEQIVPVTPVTPLPVQVHAVLINDSDYVKKAELQDSNYVKSEDLIDSQFVKSSALADSNYVKNTALIDSNYVKNTALADSGYMKASEFNDSGYVKTSGDTVWGKMLFETEDSTTFHGKFVVNADSVAKIEADSIELKGQVFIVDSLVLSQTALEKFNIATKGYHKEYVALLRVSEDPLIVTVLRNTLGTSISWAKTQTGLYVGTFGTAISSDDIANSWTSPYTQLFFDSDLSEMLNLGFFRNTTEISLYVETLTADRIDPVLQQIIHFKFIIYDY